ncbi:NUDIX hydrolase [Caldilinea sp.]|uniref:NUDIX hydrolase n=1 Tax=Caldilinea sp. TaxID=2293560 RepID=UPI002BBA1685|nr:NUDIX hydrolase [Anaerolineales bacterium]HQY91612.1 NUDIX hydrolase [Caldilinea sp.]HRA69061.1 NUDIX hydrolase [Caldilinea sp.]
MPPIPWKTQSSRPIYDNKWMHLREDIAELPDGRTTLYGVVTFGECVGVLPFVDDDNVVLVRQYRYVFGENQRWEMPTGGMKPGESPEAAALRELQEEVGYTAQQLDPVSTYYTSKSVCYEIAHLYLGYELQRAVLQPDETEFFEVAVFPFDEVLAMVNRSEIRDGMTVIAVLQAAQRRSRR